MGLNQYYTTTLVPPCDKNNLLGLTIWQLGQILHPSFPKLHSPETRERFVCLCSFKPSKGHQKERWKAPADGQVVMN